MNFADTLSDHGRARVVELVRDDPTVNGHQPELEEPIPGWRTPIALAGWGTLIAILIALIVWGIIQLAQGAPPQEPAPILITTPPTSALSPPSSVAPVVPPTRSRRTKIGPDNHHRNPDPVHREPGYTDDEHHPVARVVPVAATAVGDHAAGAAGATDRNRHCPPACESVAHLDSRKSTNHLQGYGRDQRVARVVDRGGQPGRARAGSDPVTRKSVLTLFDQPHPKSVCRKKIRIRPNPDW